MYIFIIIIVPLGTYIENSDNNMKLIKESVPFWLINSMYSTHT